MTQEDPGRLLAPAPSPKPRLFSLSSPLSADHSVSIPRASISIPGGVDETEEKKKRIKGIPEPGSVVIMEPYADSDGYNR